MRNLPKITKQVKSMTYKKMRQNKKYYV